MLKNLKLSLSDLLGEAYTDAVSAAQTALTGRPQEEFAALAHQRIEFYPDWFARRADELALRSGEVVAIPFANTNDGAPTDSFRAAQHAAMAPVAAFGCTRLGEDGRAYFIGKSEHYHASLGHQFPGYELLQLAHRMGIPNATHNNTRGFITRTAEREIVRLANRLDLGDAAGLEAVLRSEDPQVLNRVINLETGSLAVESALKMMLHRFYRLQEPAPAPRYAGRQPVFLVLADHAGGKQANYHGTTILTQCLRGMWPEFAAGMEERGLFRIEAIRINDIGDFERKLERWDRGETKVAGFFHELVLMNYGGIRLTEAFVQRAHAACRAHDVPVMVDEIQSCMWGKEQFLYLDYGITPDFVSLGKGFPGGQYPASRILTNRRMDSLNQFGALVTNGQEELAALAYLVTMRFAEANRDAIAAHGAYYRRHAEALLAEFPARLTAIEGDGLMTTFVFHRGEDALEFSRQMNASGIDVSAQSYKADCPPVALTKLPLITTPVMIDEITGRMRNILRQLGK